MADINELIEKICEETSKEKEEIKELMEERKEATHGLLSDYGAIYAVAKELNVSLTEEKVKLTPIENVEAKKPVNVYGKAKAVYPTKTFQRKDGSEGKVASVVLVDTTGEIRLTLWDKNSEIASKVSIGDAILVKNGYGRIGLNEEIEIHAGSLTTISINPDIDEKLPEIIENLLELDDIDENTGTINFIARVYAYYPATEFERPDGTKGKRASFIAEDETDRMRVVMWDKAAEVELEEGQTVKVENAYVKEGLNEEQEIHVNPRSRIYPVKQELDLPPLPETKQGQEVELEELEPEMRGFTVSARILQVFKPRQFTGGKMASLIISDGKETRRVVIWGEKAEVASELEEGDAVKIKNAYARENLDEEAEIHIGKYGEIAVDPETELPSLEKIIDQITEEKDIMELNNRDRYVEISGQIMGIDEGKRLIFYTCSNCHGKIENLGAGWFCETCDEDVEPEPNMVISFTLEDESGSIKTVAFRENAEKILEMDVEEAMNLIGETQDENAPVKEMKEHLIGEEIKLIGRATYNEFTDQLEFMVENIR